MKDLLKLLDRDQVIELRQHTDFLQNRVPWRNFVRLVDFTSDLLGELYEAKKIDAEFLASFLRNEVTQLEDKMSLLEYKWRNLLSPVVNLLKQVQ
ncbi:hypothetical protein FGIG_01373 [Fasciola gigantica]|uniref:Uncharacterized protein n=1 Tax=Fasciola gigantica TaxID=46835 RepID=A0A504Y6N4_FASGI|nr:hypothetical protein FGIG_01373 [Fasciola gigantica]